MKCNAESEFFTKISEGAMVEQVLNKESVEIPNRGANSLLSEYSPRH